MFFKYLISYFDYYYATLGRRYFRGRVGHLDRYSKSFSSYTVFINNDNNDNNNNHKYKNNLGINDDNKDTNSNLNGMPNNNLNLMKHNQEERNYYNPKLVKSR